MSRILADKVTNYNNDGPFEAEKGIDIPLNQPLLIGGLLGASGQYLISNGAGISWQDFPELFSGDYNDLVNKPVLFSGNYNDLSNKPLILDINIASPQEGDILLYEAGKWVNTDFPTIYTYTLNETPGDNDEYVNLRITDNEGSSSNVILSGSNGLQITVPEEGVIRFTSPVVSEYNADTAKDDISSMFLNGTYTGISFTYNNLTKTFDASVDLAEQLVYTLSGSSGGTNIAEIALNTTTTSNGSITLEGTSGINIAWNAGESKITFSKTDPAPYVLPTATTTTLGGVIPDANDFSIDGLGNLTVNFPSGGIALTDLSVGTEGSPSGNGSLSYDSGTGQFTYTPPLFSLNDLSDTAIVGPTVDQLLRFNGTSWVNSSVSIVSNLDDLSNVDVPSPSVGDYLYFTGSVWQSTSLNLSFSSIHQLQDVYNRSSDTAGQILLWDGTAWNPTIGKLESFDVSAQAINGQVLVWNGTTNLWDPTTLSGGGGATTLDGLNDVNVAGASSGEFLYYNGAQWTNTTIAAAPEYIGDLLDVSSTAATNGYVLTWNSTSSQWEPAAAGASPGAGLTSRTTAVGTTTLISDGQYEDININGFKSYLLMKIETSAAAWVTLYCDDESRIADASRPETTDPTPGSGVIAEVITTGAQTVLMTPTVMGFNNDTTPGATIYAKVVNKSGSTQSITVTLTLLQLEA